MDVVISASSSSLKSPCLIQPRFAFSSYSSFFSHEKQFLNNILFHFLLCDFCLTNYYAFQALAEID